MGRSRRDGNVSMPVRGAEEQGAVAPVADHVSVGKGERERAVAVERMHAAEGSSAGHV